MKRTLVKTKIVLEKDNTLVIYFWKKKFLWFGHWYPNGSTAYSHKISESHTDYINDSTVSKSLKKFLRKI